MDLGRDIVRPKDPNFPTAHDRIRKDRRMWSHFKDCIGAVDGTHILAVVPDDEKIRYIGRSKSTTQNVMAICDHDMRFTYAFIGQPGSMHDITVLFTALQTDLTIFPHPPQGKYYLVDAGYPNCPGYLAPYKGQRYHVPEFRRGTAPSGEKEKFNFLHSSLRTIIERCFGVWKMKWWILLKIPSFPMWKQKMVVAATMALHNFIRDHDAPDRHFHRFERNPDYVPTIPSRFRRYVLSQDASDTSSK